MDYENPNQRKFIIRVIAEEDNTKERHSSTATVTVMITDTNDNPPLFSHSDYSATVNEAASGGSFVAAITAQDRDSGQFGTDSIYYYLDGIDASRFVVDRFTGSISVAACDTPGKHPCLDLETKPEYHFTYTVRYSLNLPVFKTSMNPTSDDGFFFRRVMMRVRDCRRKFLCESLCKMLMIIRRIWRRCAIPRLLKRAHRNCSRRCMFPQRIRIIRAKLRIKLRGAISWTCLTLIRIAVWFWSSTRRWIWRIWTQLWLISFLR